MLAEDPVNVLCLRNLVDLIKYSWIHSLHKNIHIHELIRYIFTLSPPLLPIDSPLAATSGTTTVVAVRALRMTNSSPCYGKLFEHATTGVAMVPSVFLRFLVLTLHRGLVVVTKGVHGSLRALTFKLQGRNLLLSWYLYSSFGLVCKRVLDIRLTFHLVIYWFVLNRLKNISFQVTIEVSGDLSSAKPVAVIVWFNLLYNRNSVLVFVALLILLCIVPNSWFSFPFYRYYFDFCPRKRAAYVPPALARPPNTCQAMIFPFSVSKLWNYLHS